MKKLPYLKYLIEWHIEHFNQGMKPACYNEWLDNEYRSVRKLSVKRLCKGLKQFGGEYIIFDNGISFETWCNDRLFVILGYFKTVKAFHKRLDRDDSYVETYLNYYPNEKKVTLEIFNATFAGTEDELEIIGKARDFLIDEIEKYCVDYTKHTALELIKE